MYIYIYMYTPKRQLEIPISFTFILCVWRRMISNISCSSCNQGLRRGEESSLEASIFGSIGLSWYHIKPYIVYMYNIYMHYTIDIHMFVGTIWSWFVQLVTGSDKSARDAESVANLFSDDKTTAPWPCWPCWRCHWLQNHILICSVLGISLCNRLYESINYISIIYNISIYAIAVRVLW